MQLRSSLSRAVSTAVLSAVLSPAVMAQVPGSSPLVTPQGVAGQQPAAPPRSPQEQLDELRREIERLKAEIAFVQTRTSLGVAPLRERLQQREFKPRAIDAGKNSAVALPVAQPPSIQPARTMTPEEQTKYGADVALVVQGRPVTSAELQQLAAYVKSMPGTPDATACMMRAAQECIRVQAVMAAFEESRTEAEGQIQAAAKELAEGKPFGEVQNRYGRGPNMTQEGKVTITRYSPFGLEVEAAAFGNPEGKLVGPVRGLSGYALVQIDKLVKSDQDVGDSVEARLILVPYHGEASDMDKVRSEASMGQVDLVVRDEAGLQLLPQHLRPAVKGKEFPVKVEAAVETPEAPKKDEPKKDK